MPRGEILQAVCQPYLLGMEGYDERSLGVVLQARKVHRDGVHISSMLFRLLAMEVG